LRLPPLTELYAALASLLVPPLTELCAERGVQIAAG